MAVSSTPFNACNALVELDDSSGSLHDISGYSNSADFELSKDIKEFKVFGNQWKYRLECGKDAKVTLNVLMDKDTYGGFRLLKDWFQNGSGARRFRVTAPSDAIGNDRWWGYFLLESLSWTFSAEEAGAIMVKASLLPNGAVEYETVTT